MNQFCFLVIVLDDYVIYVMYVMYVIYVIYVITNYI